MSQYTYKDISSRSTVIMVGSNKDPYTWKKLGNSKEVGFKESLKQLFIIPPDELPLRLLTSVIPPLFVKSKYQRVYTDLLGPTILAVTLLLIIYYGLVVNDKYPEAESTFFYAFETVALYLLCVPAALAGMGYLARLQLNFLQILSLVGYSLMGHVATLSISYLFYTEGSHLVFFLSLILFGGMSALRISLVLLYAIQRPAARLLVCSLASIFHLLYAIYLHYIYMHKTFVYENKATGTTQHAKM